jgi:hypothetical protein
MNGKGDIFLIPCSYTVQLQYGNCLYFLKLLAVAASPGYYWLRRASHLQSSTIGPCRLCMGKTSVRCKAHIFCNSMQKKMHKQINCLWNIKIFCGVCKGQERTFITPSVSIRGSQRDVVYLGWPIAPSYISPTAGGGRGGVSANGYSCAHGDQINFGDLTQYLTYDFNPHAPTNLHCFFFIGCCSIN